MNETVSLILNRRSVRKYKSTPIDPKTLELILQCGLYAPNGGGHQVPRFLVTQGSEVLEIDKLVSRALASKPILPEQYQNKSIILAKEHPEFHFFFDAPVLITAIAPTAHANSMADCSCALENMQLAATALGLGACWVNQLHWSNGDKNVFSWLSAHGMRDDESVFGSIVIGCPDAVPTAAAERKAGRIIYVPFEA